MNFKREAFLFVVFLLIIQVLFIFDSNANTYFYALSSYVLCYQLFKFRNKNITSIKNLPYKYLIDIYYLLHYYF